MPLTNNTIPTPKPAKTKRSSCFLKILVICSIGFIIALAGCFYLYDQISGNAAERFEKKENKRLEKETLPDEYKSYPDFSELVSTDKYTVTEFPNSYPKLYYFLPDGTLVIAEQYGGTFFRINTEGEIIDYYNNSELNFYGTSLMKYIISYPSATSDKEPDEDSDIVIAEAAVQKPTSIGGFYSNWPLNGDTTLFAIQPIANIVPTKKLINEAYDKADVVEYIYTRGEIEPARMLLHIGDVWYISDYVPDKPTKEIHSRRSTDQEKYLSDVGVNVIYKKRNRFYRARSAGYLSGGMLNYDHWEGDAYLHLKIGNTIVRFKKNYTEDKGKYNFDYSRIYLDIINTGNYAIANNYIIRPIK